MDTATDTYTIDASGKRIGRIASEAARALMGKHKPSYMPNAFPTTHVTITGANSLDISDKKASTKLYKRYSGYPGGQTLTPLSKIVADKGAAEALRHAIRGMLPANKLRARRLKLLTIEG
ncbi:MAG TPA: 50S ribosomal protein L13 [Candidatus Paceibacterota bacterium]|nr:50S ribosomal protein L13 [Candidatus Paceibacterota bacterium]